MKKPQDTVTIRIGSDLLKQLDNIHNYKSRSALFKRFIEHYTNNPIAFENVMWDMEKPKQEGEVK